MPRKYKRKTEFSPIDSNKVLEALKAVKIEKCSVKSVARDHNIPRSSLCRYITKINESFSDISTISDQKLLDCIKSFTSRGSKTIFSPAEEEALIKYLLDAKQLGSGLKRNDICRMTLEFAKKNEVDYPKSWNEREMASRDWLEPFMRRHTDFTGQSMDQTVEMDTKNDLCRACLLHSDSVMTSLLNHIVEISDSLENCSEHLSLAEIYNQCIGIEVDSPQDMLCEDCAQKLIEFHKFRRMCHQSYKNLCQTDEQCFSEKIDIDDIKETIFDDISLQENQTEVFDNTMDDAHMNDPIDETIEQCDIAELKFEASTEELQCQQETVMRLSDDIAEENFEASTEETAMKSSDDNETQITCDLCPKIFFKRHRYEGHLRTHAGLKPYQCNHCEKEFIKYFTLKEHLATKHGPTPKEKQTFICDASECGKIYSHKESLRLHMLKFHSGKKIDPMELKKVICETCGKLFQNNAALIRHNYTHTKTSSHKCQVPECGKMFPTKFKLKEHTMRHEGIKNFSCTICGLRKATKHELNVHMRNHNKEITYPCPICSTPFTQLMNMKRHIKVVHEGMKNFKCDHENCNRAFAKLETLKNHIMTHTGEKPFECPCGRKFIQQVALRTHQKTHRKKNMNKT